MQFKIQSLIVIFMFQWRDGTKHVKSVMAKYALETFLLNYILINKLKRKIISKLHYIIRIK
jgi:hypothetical protein